MSALPIPAPLSSLPALRPAAAAALDVTPGELIERWLAGLSTTARRAYGRSLARFARWAMDGEAAPTDALRLLCGLDAAKASELARRWRDDELVPSGLASGSVAGYLVALSSLVRAARRAGLCTFALEAVLPRTEPRRDMRGPTLPAMQRLIGTIDDAATAGSANAARDAAVVRLMFSAGLRRAEVGSLRFPDDVALDTPDGAILRVLRKGHRERKNVLIPPGAAAAIERWLVHRGAQPGPLFVRVKGRTAASAGLNGETIRRMLATWAKRAGVRAACRPHGCRHAGASEIARRGSLSELVAYGQWSSLTSARKYLDDRQAERASALRLVDL